MRVLVALLLLPACSPALIRGSELPPRPAHATVLDIVEETWRELGLGWSETCDAERERMAIALVDDATMRRVRGYCAADSPLCRATSDLPKGERELARATRGGCLLGYCVAGSMIREFSEPWPIGLVAPWRVTLLISQYPPETVHRAAIVHEYAHSLYGCVFGSADYEHSDPRIWGRDGVVRRATARAAQ
jgi:hypothetical protein